MNVRVFFSVCFFILAVLLLICLFQGCTPLPARVGKDRIEIVVKDGGVKMPDDQGCDVSEDGTRILPCY